MSLQSLLESVLSNDLDREPLQQQLDHGKAFYEIVDSAPAHLHGQLSLACTLLSLSSNHYAFVETLIKDSRVKALADAAELYYIGEEALTLLSDEHLSRWRKEIFLLQPTAVLKALVVFGEIPVGQDIKPLVTGIFSNAITKQRDITRQPFRTIIQGYTFPENTPATAQTEALERFKDIQRLQCLVSEPELIRNLWDVLKPGQRSAQYIAGCALDGFVADVVPTGLPEEKAQKIHNNAILVRMRNEQTWASLLRSKTELRLPALEDQSSKPDTSLSEEPQPVSGVNYVKIFDEMESIECDDTESVLSPAAYLVDLLKTLDEVKVTDELTLLGCLSQRRPDLQELELSSANTKVLIPYIDLVNEVLESFVRHSVGSQPDELIPIDAYNMADSDTSAICEQQPRNVDASVYMDLIQPQFYPPTVFPYNHAVDSMRAFLEALGSSLSQLRSALQSEYRLIEEKELSRPNSQVVLRAARVMVDRAMMAEKLGLQEEDLIAITRQGFMPVERCRQLSSGLITLPETEFERRNGFPGTAALWGYSNGTAEMLDMKKAQGLAYVKKQLLPRSGLSFEELIEILKTEFMAGRLILAPGNGSSQFSSKLDDLRLCASALVNADGELTEELCHDLQAFLRLRKCTGWDIAVLDAALSCLSRDKDYQDASRVRPETICELASIQELSKATDLNIQALLPWWGDLFTNGDDSLYAMLFLRHTIKETGLFVADINGRFLSDENATTFSHVIMVLTSALRVSAAELVQLQDLLRLGPDPALTMSNVSLVYRVISFCRALNIQFAQYPLFRDIFTSNVADIFETPSTTLAIVRQWQSLVEGGWTLSQLGTCIKTSKSQHGLTGKAAEPSPYRNNVLKTVRTILSSAETINSAWPIIHPDSGQSASDDDIEKVMAALYGKQNVAQKMQSFKLESQAAGEKGKIESLDDKRNDKHNELVLDLRLRLLQRRVFDTVNADFPDITASMIRLIMSDIAKVSSSKTSAMHLLQSLPQISLKDNKSAINGFFSPTATEKFYFMSTGPKEALLFIDDIPIELKNGSSSGVRLLSGQVYNLRYDGKFDQLHWRTDLLGETPFPTQGFLDVDMIQTAEKAYEAIARIASIVTLAKLDLEELQFFTGSLGSKVIDFDKMSLKEVLKLQTYRKARESLSAANRSPLLAFYKWIARSDKKPEDLADQIVQVSGWSLSLVQDTLRAKYPSLGVAEQTELFNSIEEFAALKTAIDHLFGISIPGVSVEQIFKWATPPMKLNDFFELAEGMREALQVQDQSAASPQTAVAKAYDRLRENQRKALIQYILNNPALRTRARIIDSDSLFEYLLIDVNMGPKLQSSRVKQAISTIQLFVQRCFQGLELVPGLADQTKIKIMADLKAKWVYMEKYTLWEANRKIFLYPENWVDPTLRDDKSEQFRVLESAILQNNVSLESVTDAVKAYIFDTNTIANLDVQAYLWERREAGEGRFHFFARTRTIPYQFFYRYMDLKKFGERFTYWYPWTRLDLGALPQSVDRDNKSPEGTSTYLVPSVVRGRLFLFVPEIMLRTKEPEEKQTATLRAMARKRPSEIQNQVQYWEIKMAWTELRSGKWNPKVFSPDILQVEPRGTHNQLPSLEQFKFGVRARNAFVKTVSSGSQITSKASFKNGVEDFLIIDVETYSTDSEKTTAHLLGQFEMRGSQLYLKPKKDIQSPYRTKTPLTAPTKFSKLQWEGPGLPAYNLVEDIEEMVESGGKKEPRTRRFFNDPLLIDVKKEENRTLTWTMSFDATQYSRPLGLVVDVATSTAGAQTYFARPPAEELSPEMQSQTLTDHAGIVLLDHPNSALLTEYAARNSELEPIYQTMTTKRSPEELSLLFGNVRGKVYHELFAPNSIYNWELGVHAVSLLMERFLITQQFEQALKIGRLVFDPTINGSNLRDCWLFPPFADKEMSAQSTGDLLETLNPKFDKEIGRQMTYQDMQVAEWQANPFNAHAVARGRPATYMKRIVMKYIEILIAAGDNYFRQASLEAIPLAIQRYVEASHLFGPGMRRMKRLGRRPKKTYSQIVNQMDSFSNVTVDMELDLPFSCVLEAVGTKAAAPDDPRQGLLGFVTSTYFGVPTNPQLLALRDLIDDRLFKIRNCQDINGNPLKLPLFDPPLNPGMLVQNQAGGLADVSMLLNDLDSPMPNYRFVFLLQKAFDMVNELRSMADFFLSAKEKRDGEALSRLKSKQEIAIQSMMVQVKNLQKEEATKSIEALQDLRRSHVSRLQYYLALVGESRDLVPGEQDEWTDIKQQIDTPTKDDDLRMSINEKLEMEKANSAADLTMKASLLDTTAAALVALPNLTTNAQPMGMGMTVKFDAENVAKAMTGTSTVMKLMAEYQSNEGARAARKAQMIRQLQERRLQANVAGREIKNVDKQIATQRTRMAICDAEIRIQGEQLAQAQQTDEWYRSKYTSEQLYAWIESSSRTLLYESYLLAIDLARKAEKAFQFEYVPGKPTTFLNPQGYWDSGRDGLLAAQNIQLALKRMETAYLDSSPSDFEICKVISLRQINPRALFDLRLNGEAQFSLPEVLFDMDFPGHYFRRIKSVTVSVPCITGPYTSLNCTLSLLENRYRVRPATPDNKYTEQGDRDDRFRTDRIPISSIAVGERSIDSGRFDLNFSGERFLPFENAGVLSTWKIELPRKVRQFDYETISDVVLQIRYTSRQGGGKLKAAAEAAVEQYMKQATELSKDTKGPDGLYACVDLKNEFSNEFLALTKSSSAVKDVSLTGLADRLPFWSRGQNVMTKNIALYVQIADKKKPFGGSFEITSARVKLENGKLLSEGWTKFSVDKAEQKVGDWPLKLNVSSAEQAKQIQRAFLFYQYTVSAPAES